MSQRLSVKAAHVLEWPRLLEVLAGYAKSFSGARLCRDLALADDLETTRVRQQETAEMAALSEGSEPFPMVSFPDIREVVLRAGKGGVLSAQELHACGMVLALMEEIDAYMARHQHTAAALALLTGPLASVKDCRMLRGAIVAAIEPDGAIKESATPELRRLTQHALELKQEMRQRLDRLLHSSRYADVLQEAFFAQREGRYVVPVKADMRGRIPGIVHDVSASGATVFVEPRELINLNNSIKVADLEIEREVRRILRELTLLLGSHASELVQGADVLALLDCIGAKAALGRRLQASAVALNDDGRVRVRQARHPLLMLAKDAIVPNDIDFDETIRVLIISGPNTGGKTVTLKIIGLFSLMVRAGLHLPCAPESDMALFTHLYADIGDAQDLSQDLSSFSAHMTHMVELLAESVAGSRPEGGARSLVLLDEPVTSTEPQEGAALAEALLCHLASLNMKVIATTHYGSLKTLAQTTPGFGNASVEFDVERLAPTYRLWFGVPGGSSALEIAARLGMDEAVLRDARNRLQTGDRRLDALLKDLHAKQRQLAGELEQAARASAQAQASARDADQIRTRLEQAEREARSGLKKKLGEHFQRARAEVQAAVEAFRKEPQPAKARETKQRLVELERQMQAEVAPLPEPIPVEQLGAGSAIEIIGLGVMGTLLEPPHGKKRVRVKVGEGEVLATVASLSGVTHPTTQPPHPRPATSAAKQGGGQGGWGDDVHTVVDVRGRAADEALEIVVAALDRATLVGGTSLRIIHGQGTGRLKSVLRHHLKESPYVADFRPGERPEGGDGVTIVRLR